MGNRKFNMTSSQSILSDLNKLDLILEKVILLENNYEGMQAIIDVIKGNQSYISGKFDECYVELESIMKDFESIK